MATPLVQPVYDKILTEVLEGGKKVDRLNLDTAVTLEAGLIEGHPYVHDAVDILLFLHGVKVRADILFELRSQLDEPELEELVKLQAMFTVGLNEYKKQLINNFESK